MHTPEVPCLLHHHTGVPRLFDLVRVREERVKLAFYFALRDTVVADSLDQASRIAYGKDRRWGRVVTIKVRHSLQGADWHYAAGAVAVAGLCQHKAQPRAHWC